MFKPSRKITGRKKIEIKKLDKEANKQVTFSKRRSGLFKKASELCILCNAHAAIIVFSPADKLFCFGEPNTEAVVKRFLLKGTRTDQFEEPITTTESNKGKSSSSLSCEEHNRKYEEKIKILEMEKKRLKEMQSFAKVCRRGEWWNEQIDEMMSVEQVEQFVVAINELRRRLAERAGELMMIYSIL